MRNQIETVTPRRAQEILDVHWVKEHQRRPMSSVVDAYARAMRAGQWALTHQGIAIADNDELIDGLHRLLAIVQSGASVRMFVARGVPATAANGARTIDMLDRGAVRSVGQQLTLGHGVVNGTMTAAAARIIIVLACRKFATSTPGAQNVANILAAMDAFGDVQRCVSGLPAITGIRVGAVGGAFALAMRSHRDTVEPAYEQFCAGTNLEPGNPMLALLRHLQVARPIKGTGSKELLIARAVLNALRAVVMREPLAKVSSVGESGVEFFLEANKRTAKKVLLACGYIEAAE